MIEEEKIKKIKTWINTNPNITRRQKINFKKFIEEDLQKSYKNGYEQAMKDTSDFIGLRYLYKIKDIKKYQKEADFLGKKFKQRIKEE